MSFEQGWNSTLFRSAARRFAERFVPVLEGSARAIRRLAHLAPEEEPEVVEPGAAVDDVPLRRAEQTQGSGRLPTFEVDMELPLQERLVLFLENVRGATGSYAGFIVDSQGLPLVSRNSSEEHMALSAALDRALTPIRASLRGNPQGSASLELDGHNVLQMIWANTANGRYGVGLIVPESLAGEFVLSIRVQLDSLLADTQGHAA